MTQSAKTIGRRDMLRGGAIALALTGAAAIPLATANANTQDDLLASGICDLVRRLQLSRDKTSTTSMHWSSERIGISRTS